MKAWLTHAELDALDEQARAAERRLQRVTLVVPGRDEHGEYTYTVVGHRPESAFERACRLEREAAAATCRTRVLVEVEVTGDVRVVGVAARPVA